MIYYRKGQDFEFEMVDPRELFYKVLSKFNVLGVYYSLEDYSEKEKLICLHKHGDYLRVKKRYLSDYEKFKHSRLDIDIRIKKYYSCDFEKLNHFIQTSALPESWLKKIEVIDV